MFMKAHVSSMINIWNHKTPSLNHRCFSPQKQGTCRPQPVSVLLLLLLWVVMASAVMDLSGFENGEDILTPYGAHHGPLHRTHRDTQKCQSIRYGNVTHSKHPAASSSVPLFPIVESHYMIREFGDQYWNKRVAYIHHQIVNDPMMTFSVVEPSHPGTCQNGSAERATVEVSAEQKQCIVAMNAGFFDTTTGECKGNIVIDGFLVQDSGGIQNAHFGVTKDGYLYTGYLSDIDLLAQDFSQLVGGVVWLVRDGESYVDESKSIECPETEETGSVDRFINVISARTAVGHDAEGKIHLVQVDGQTDVRGVNLYELSELLIELGVVNAVNLDGGGSATMVINGTLVNYPSDQCVNSTYNCPRNVSTILCVHKPDCSSKDCSGHGSCDMGVCHCEGLWAGPACDRLECPQDCSWHGQCSQDGCQCYAGWRGENCSLKCQDGWYGQNCLLPCACKNGAVCNSVTGACQCQPGYSGDYCETVCPFGFYGQDCGEMCYCDNSCHCHHVTGSCDATLPHGDVYKVGQCLAQQEIKAKHLVPDIGHQYSICVASSICLSIVAACSLVVNVVLTYFLVATKKRHRSAMKKNVRLAVKHVLRKVAMRGNNSENDDEDDEEGLNHDNMPLLQKTKHPHHKGGQDEKEKSDDNDEDSHNTGTGESEDDLFLAPKKPNGKPK